MGVIGALLVVIFIIAAILLVVLILIQDEQGEGLGGIFGGGSSTPFGSRSGNVLTRFTSILAAVFLFCSFAIAWVNRGGQTGDVLGAAKREAAQTAKEWWLTPVNSNAKLPSDLSAQESADQTQPVSGAGGTGLGSLPLKATSNVPGSATAPELPAQSGNDLAK